MLLSERPGNLQLAIAHAAASAYCRDGEWGFSSDVAQKGKKSIHVHSPWSDDTRVLQQKHPRPLSCCCCCCCCSIRPNYLYDAALAR